MNTRTEVSTVVFAPSSIEQIQPMKLKLSRITKVENDKDLETAQVVLKESKQLFKEIETERKGFTVRLDNVKANAMQHEKDLKASLEPVDLIVSTYLKNKEIARQAAADKIAKEQSDKLAKEKKAADHKQALLDFEIDCKKCIIETTTLTEINNMKKVLLSYELTEEKFGEHLQAAMVIKKEVIKLCEKQHKAISNGKDLNVDIKALEEKKEEVLEQQENNLRDIEITAQVKTQALGTVSGIRKVWTFKVDDLTKVPAEYLIVDEAKIKAMITAGERSIPGLTIFQDVARSGK